MMNLTEIIGDRGMTQSEAAAFFGVTQPRISDLMRGKINLFSLDTPDGYGGNRWHATHCHSVKAQDGGGRFCSSSI